MFDLKKYQDEKGFSTSEAVKVIKKVYPRFNKAQYSMCRNSEAYGVRLSTSAEKALRKAYGEFNSKSKRKKNNRMTARFSDADFKKIKEAMAYYNCGTAQEFIELAVSQMLMPGRMEDERL